MSQGQSSQKWPKFPGSQQKCAEIPILQLLIQVISTVSICPVEIFVLQLRQVL